MYTVSRVVNKWCAGAQGREAYNSTKADRTLAAARRAAVGTGRDAIRRGAAGREGREARRGGGGGFKDVALRCVAPSTASGAQNSYPRGGGVAGCRTSLYEFKVSSVQTRTLKFISKIFSKPEPA